jgi:ribokinase
LEIPLETVAYAIGLCRELGVFTILDPAPVPPEGLPTALHAVDLLTPNQTEAELILGRSEEPARKLLERGARSVVLKLGASGSMYADQERTEAAKPFTGALAVAHAERLKMSAALRFANAAGAICCQTVGAQAAIPTRAAVQSLIATDAPA